MKLWREIVSTAIVGTDRQKFELSAPGDDQLSRTLQSQKSNDQEADLLKAAAVIGAYLKNGINSVPDKEDLSEPAADEKFACTSRQTERHLAAMLSGNYRQVLPEFFDLTAKKERILPPQFLPEVLNIGSSNRDLRKYILPVIGERGRWLARYNEDWRWTLIEENIAEIWQNGSRDERIFAIESMRRQNPSEARELLIGDWQSESAKDRATFLEVLRVNLSQSDEGFLAKVLQTDKSSEVRRIALNLLLGISDSNLVKNITERAAALFNFKPGGFLSMPKIEIDFPEDFEAETKDDVLNNLEIYLNEKDLGKKALKIVKLLQCVPPKVWEEKFSTKKENIIEAAKQSDWRKALLIGLKLSAVNFADEEWLISVLPENQQNEYYLLCNQIERRWTNLQIEKLIARLLEGKMKNGIGSDFATLLFYRLKNIWSDDFTLKILDFLQKPSIEKDLKLFGDLLNHILNSGEFISARYSNRFEEKNFLQLFEKLGELPGKAKIIEEFTSVIHFRREMQKAFESEE